MLLTLHDAHDKLLNPNNCHFPLVLLLLVVFDVVKFLLKSLNALSSVTCLCVCSLALDDGSWAVS